MIDLLQQADTTFVVQVAQGDPPWLKLATVIILSIQAVVLAFLYRQGFQTHKAVNSERTASTDMIAQLKDEVSSVKQHSAVLTERLIVLGTTAGTLPILVRVVPDEASGAIPPAHPSGG